MSKHKKPNNANSSVPSQSNTHSLQKFPSNIGALPPPEVLIEYDELSPGIAERIIRMAERNQEHRICIETAASKRHDIIVENEYKEVRLGQIFGFLSVLSLFLLSAWIVYMGHPIPASFLAGTTMISVGGAYIYRDLKNSKNSSD